MKDKKRDSCGEGSDQIRSQGETQQDVDTKGEETIASHHLSPARARLKSASAMGLGRAASAPLERKTCTPA
jgi:hypothetical protein